MNHTSSLSAFNQCDRGNQGNKICAGENMNRLGRSLLALLAFAFLMCLSVAEAQVTYSIGVNLAGLSGGTVILKNGSDTLPLGTNGSYSFATPLALGSPYAVSVLIQPPSQTCSVSGGDNGNGSGTVAGASVIVGVNCVSAYTVSGTISGLAGSGLVLRLNSTSLIVANGANSFKFATALTDAAPYLVSVGIQPVGYTCLVTNGSGNIAGANVTDVLVACAKTYTVGGAITGLTGSGLRLALNGGASKLIASNATSYVFSTALTSGTAYSVAIQTQPSGQFCSVSGGDSGTGSGAIASANVTNVGITCSSVHSAAISGTVFYSGTKTGRVYLSVTDQSCACTAAGTSIVLTGSPGSYSGNYVIRGIPAGTTPTSYTVTALLDTVGYGYDNASDPAATSPVTDLIAGNNSTGLNLNLVEPATPLPLTPAIYSVNAGSGFAMIEYDTPYNNDGQELATSYKVYWGTDAAASNGGSKVIPAGAYDCFVGGLTNGTLYYFKMSALVGGTESAPSKIVSKTINAGTGGRTVSGTISFAGAANSGAPLYVNLVNNVTGKIYVTRVTGPLTSPVAYTITGVPNGFYYVQAFVDNNSDGTYDVGDFSLTYNIQYVPMVAVSSNVNIGNIALPSGNADIKLTTYTYTDTPNIFSLYMLHQDELKHAVALTLISGPGVDVPFDIGFDNYPSGDGISIQLGDGSGLVTPAVNDTYVFNVTYSDGTSENLSAKVTGVLNISNAVTSVTVAGGATPLVPTISWSASPSLPAGGYYVVNLSGSDGNSWTSSPINLTSVAYNFDGYAGSASLTTGQSYSVYITVYDANGNSVDSTAEAIYYP